MGTGVVFFLQSEHLLTRSCQREHRVASPGKWIQGHSRPSGHPLPLTAPLSLAPFFSTVIWTNKQSLTFDSAHPTAAYPHFAMRNWSLWARFQPCSLLPPFSPVLVLQTSFRPDVNAYIRFPLFFQKSCVSHLSGPCFPCSLSLMALFQLALHPPSPFAHTTHV